VNSSQPTRLRRLKAEMRLLDTSTFALKEFVDDSIPRYSILSHRWRDSEVTFQDLHGIQDGRAVGKKGWSKIQGCCRQGVKDGLHWVWIDSCCIDKTSSAELSEAINSMFDWYRKAELCYVYLSGVPGSRSWNGQYMAMSAFCLSGWFSRGWNLQELLAPKKLVFFDQD
jgi:hypothetical protein